MGSAKETIESLSLKATYAKIDPLKPQSFEIAQDLTADQLIPNGVLTKDGALALQSIEVIGKKGSASLWRLQRPELDPLRTAAAGGLQPKVEITGFIDNGTKLSANIFLPPQKYWELPIRISPKSLRSIVADLLDFFRLDDLSDSLLKMRWASSATQEYHEELLALAELTPAMDQSRLELLLDGFYFPTTQIGEMKKRERELLISDQPGDIEKLSVLQKNIQIAEQFAEFSNRLVISGMRKIGTLSIEQGIVLLDRLHPGKEKCDIAFEQLIQKNGGSLDSLLENQKMVMLELSLKRKALGFAANLATDMFAKGQDKSVGALIDLTRRFPPSPERDRLTLNALMVDGAVSVAELAALITPLQSKELLLQIAEALLPRIKSLSTQQILTLTEQRAPDEIRDTLMLMAVRQAERYDSDSIRALLLMATNWTVRNQMAALILPKMAPLNGKAFAVLVQVLPAESSRDSLLFQGLALMSSLTPADYAALADLITSDSAYLEFLDKATPRLTPFRMIEAIATTDLLLGRPVDYRDQFVIRAAGLVTDLSWENLDQLLIRTSSDGVRARVREIATRRLGPKTSG
jgi:hypothetical protein